MNVTFSPYRPALRFGGQKEWLDKLRQKAAIANATDVVKGDERVASLSKLSFLEILDQMLSTRPDQSLSTAASKLILERLDPKDPKTRQPAKNVLMALRNKVEAFKNPKAAASVPDWLVTGLIERMGYDPIDAKDVDHYKGPIFSPVAEEAFLRHVKNTTISVPFLVDVLDYEVTNDRVDSPEALQAVIKLTEMTNNGCTAFSLSKEQKDFNPFPAATISDMLEKKGFFQDGKDVPPMLFNAIKENYQ